MAVKIKAVIAASGVYPLKIIGPLLLATCFGLDTGSVLASQIYPYTDGIRQEAKVSANHINRIKFGDVPLTQVIGDESKYNIVLDERAQNMFLTLKVAAGQQVDLFLVNAAGEVADLNLKVENIDSQTLEINPIRVMGSSTEKSEVNMMLENMIAGRGGKYYVINTNRKVPGNNPGFEIIQDQTYRWGGLTGARLKVKNTAYNVVNVSEGDFAGLFKNSKAVCIEDKQLNKGRSTNVWVITGGAGL